MDKITIYADKGRESGVIEYLRNMCPLNKIKLCEQQMTVADFAIDYNGKTLAIIERKRWDDLANTIKTPNRKDNHNKLINYRNDAEYKTHIIYFIEGASPFIKDPISGVTANQLYGFLDSVSLRDECFVMYTMNLENTAQRLITLAIKYDKIKRDERKEENRIILLSIPKLISEPTLEIDEIIDNNADNNVINNPDNNIINNADLDISDNISECSFCSSVSTSMTTGTRTRLRINKTFDEMRDDCLLELNGITKENISELRKYKIADLLFGTLDLKEISELSYPRSNRKFGSVLAKKILTQTTADHHKFLDAVRGITTKTAKIIMNKYEMRDLINLSITALSAIPKSKLQTLGKSTATLIHNIINS